MEELEYPSSTRVCDSENEVRLSLVARMNHLDSIMDKHDSILACQRETILSLETCEDDLMVLIKEKVPETYICLDVPAMVVKGVPSCEMEHGHGEWKLIDNPSESSDSDELIVLQRVVGRVEEIVKGNEQRIKQCNQIIQQRSDALRRLCLFISGNVT